MEMGKTTYNVNSNGSVHDIEQESGLPPHNIEAEEALLGSIFIDPDRFEELDITPKMFFGGFQREIYSAFTEIRSDKGPIDFITVMDILRRKGIEKDGELIGLMNLVPTSTNIHKYASIVRTDWNRRRLIGLGGKLATLGFDNDEDVEDIITVGLESIRAIGGDLDNDDPVSSKVLATEMMDELTMRRTDKDYREQSNIATGFIDLDRILDGIEREALVIIAARPGIGKTMLENEIRTHNLKAGKRVATFNLEMSKTQLTQRYLASRLQMPYKKLKNPQMMSDNEWVAVGKALGEYSEYKLFVDDSASLSITEAEAKMHRLFASHGYFDLVTFDYLQLMQGSKTARNRDAEIGEISRGLKRIAKDLNTVVIACAQVNRSLENRQEKMPLLSDMRESGNIEQDADIVIGASREDYYDTATSRPNIMDVGVLKHRNGPTGMVSLYFSGERMRISNLKANPVPVNL